MQMNGVTIMRRLAHIFCVAAILVVTACAEQQAPDAGEVDASMRTYIDEFVAAWNAGDQATLMTMLAEDVVLMQPDGPPLVNRTAILETMAGGYDIETSEQSATVDEVIALGDHAYTRGTWKLEPKAGADGSVLNGKWSTLCRRGADGTWQISRWMWNQPSGSAPPGR